MPRIIAQFALTTCCTLLFMSCFAKSIQAEETVPLPIGFMEYTFSDISIEDTKVAIDFYLQKLLRGTGNKPKAVIFSHLGELRQSLQKKEIDMASLSSIDFLRLEPDSVLTPILVRIQTNGKLFDTYVLLVNKKTQWSTLTDLKNTSLRIQNSDDLGSYWLHVELAKAQLPKAMKFFNSVAQDRRPAQSILSVFFGQSDACLVNTTTFETMSKLNPQIAQQLVPIMTSPPFISGFLCAHSQMPAPRKKIIQDTTLNLSKSDDGYQVIRLFNTQDLLLFQTDHLATVVDLFNQYKKYYGTTDIQY